MGSNTGPDALPAAAAMPPTRAQELRAFAMLAVLLAPVLAVLIVAGWGFLVWMLQLLAGPPGPSR